MRKLIVLLMTSVLATGAVAQADQVNVVKNPSDFIKIVDIKGADGETLPYDDKSVRSIDPYTPGADANYQRLEVVVDDPDDQLTQVSACIFDADVITDPDETDCGNGFENPEDYNTSGGSEPPRSAATGAFKPESLIQMSFLPGLQAAQNEADNSVNVVLPETASNNPFNHKVTNKGSFTGDGSFAVERDFDNFTVTGGGSAYRISFHFAVLFAAKHGDNWKVRVVATYRDSEGIDSNVELIGTDTYSVRYFGAFTELDEADFPTPETKRNAATVNYGDVIQGGDSTVDNISTGSYLTNAASDISLSADVFSGTNSEGDLDFSGNATPASGEAGLGCRPISSSDPLEFFTNPAAGQTSSLVLLSSVRANSNPGVGDDARDPIDAEKHECTFYAGDSVTTGSYSNTVTVGIGES